MGGCPSGGAKPPGTSSFFKIKNIFDVFSGKNIGWWFLLRNYQR
jgi:hypothetical protein